MTFIHNFNESRSNECWYIDRQQQKPKEKQGIVIKAFYNIEKFQIEVYGLQLKR